MLNVLSREMSKQFTKKSDILGHSHSLSKTYYQAMDNTLKKKIFWGGHQLFMQFGKCTIDPRKLQLPSWIHSDERPMLETSAF